MLAQDYPLGEIQYPCKYNETMSAIEVEGYKYLPSGDEKLLKDAIAALGPISVGIEIAEDFFSYGSGVFDTSSCKGHINHAVLLIGANLLMKTMNKSQTYLLTGYGTDPNYGDYWIGKNSW